jgi:hypothetical protein
MSYAAVATAKADATLVGKVKLALEKKSAIQIVALVNDGDQRERIVCQRILADSGVPTPLTDLVLLMMDINGTLASATDAQIDASVDSVWVRMIALVAGG